MSDACCLSIFPCRLYNATYLDGEGKFGVDAVRSPVGFLWGHCDGILGFILP